MSSETQSPIQSPIADLSYRHYDGPLNSNVARWWSIAKFTIRMATKRRAFWGWSIFSAWWYLILLAVFWFVDNVLPIPPGVGDKNPFLSQIVWKDQFIHAFSYSQMLLMVIALLVGAGSIANDNRSNALLVYLSKPCSRLDYILGKWLGVFLLMTTVSLVPMMFFYLYGVLSFQEYGFWTSAPWLFLRLIVVAASSGALYASLSLGISSLFNQGRLAGATFAVVYFLSYIFTGMVGGFNAASSFSKTPPPKMVKQLFYCSVDGIQIGLAKNIIGSDGGAIFPGFSPNQRRQARNPNAPVLNTEEFYIKAPNPQWVVPVYLIIVISGFLVAWRRIRAVEVVG